jgi:hypothetical protein
LLTGAEKRQVKRYLISDDAVANDDDSDGNDDGDFNVMEILEK